MLQHDRCTMSFEASDSVCGACQDFSTQLMQCTNTQTKDDKTTGISPQLFKLLRFLEEHPKVI
jgi:hypothetical protein